MVAAKKPDEVMAALALEPEARERLAKLAEEQGRAVDELVRAWVLQHLEEDLDGEDLAELERRSAALEADGEGIPHDEVAAYLRSLGTDKELPCPKQRRM
jgi:predicted transcriptional regulator